MPTVKSTIKHLFVLAHLGDSSCTWISVKQNALANWAALAVVLITIL